ncbi:MAG: PPOX class F420-dependent oxidoreductase [Acidimicrobiales bacterium]
MGVNQRSNIRLSDAEVTAFLQGRQSMSLATLGAGGAIHLVAMWYGFIGDVITIETKAKSQKVQNLRRDPRFTALVEDGDTYETLRGVELVGRAELSEDPDELWQVGVSLFERYYGPVTPETEPFVKVMLNKRVAVKLHVDKVVSWDHRKLG